MQILWFRCDEIIGGTAIAVGLIALCLGGLFMHQEFADEPGTDRHCKMSNEAESNLERFKREGHTAFVLGYTGESGKALIKDMGRLKIFTKVVLIGRREVKLDPTLGPEFEQKVVDFEKLEDSRSVFTGLDTGFCCIGTTRAKSGSSGFVRVDHDYVLNAASIAKEEGCKHFSLVSSMGANKNTSLLYTRTKGQVEEALKVMHFDRLSVYRPAALLCDRQEKRTGEAVAQFFLKPVAYLFPTAITIPTVTLARAMLINAVAPGDKVETYENKAIHQLAGNTYCKPQTAAGAGDTEADKQAL